MNFAKLLRACVMLLRYQGIGRQAGLAPIAAGGLSMSAKEMPKAPMFNACSESADTTNAFKSTRCPIPADGFQNGRNVLARASVNVTRADIAL